MFTIIVTKPNGDQIIESAVSIRNEITHVKRDKGETQPKVKWWKRDDPMEYYTIEGLVRVVNENGKDVMEYRL